MAGVPAAADRRRWSAEAGIGCRVRPGLRWPASSGHPKYRESGTYVAGPGRCEPPGGRRRRKSEPGGAASSRGLRGSLADRRRGAKKILGCVTTRGRNLGFLKGLRRDFAAVPAVRFRLGMLGLDAGILAPVGLTAGRLPALDLPLALRVLAAALVPAPRLVLASTSFAQADPRARLPRSGQPAVSWRT
jgi:hypothetical protein